MKFTHVIIINDPLNPLANLITTEQLWRGLVLRAEQPMLFVAHLDACHILEKFPHLIKRELRYGKVTIHDIVSFLPQLQVRYQVPQQQDLGGSSMTMTIEQPQPEVLYIRFTYEDDIEEGPDSSEAFYNEYRRSAYLESDIDTVRLIREFAAMGRLG
ncbi:MAG: SRPBCC family protein [Glaciimonas sp.]|nr:SRPBCC family protein [Glaciimonas sp.]